MSTNKKIKHINWKDRHNAGLAKRDKNGPQATVAEAIQSVASSMPSNDVVPCIPPPFRWEIGTKKDQQNDPGAVTPNAKGFFQGHVEDRERILRGETTPTCETLSDEMKRHMHSAVREHDGLSQELTNKKKITNKERENAKRAMRRQQLFACNTLVAKMMLHLEQPQEKTKENFWHELQRKGCVIVKNHLATTTGIAHKFAEEMEQLDFSNHPSDTDLVLRTMCCGASKKMDLKLLQDNPPNHALSWTKCFMKCCIDLGPFSRSNACCLSVTDTKPGMKKEDWNTTQLHFDRCGMVGTQECKNVPEECLRQVGCHGENDLEKVRSELVDTHTQGWMVDQGTLPIEKMTVCALICLSKEPHNVKFGHRNLHGDNRTTKLTLNLGDAIHFLTDCFHASCPPIKEESHKCLRWHFAFGESVSMVTEDCVQQELLLQEMKDESETDSDDSEKKPRAKKPKTAE